MNNQQNSSLISVIVPVYNVREYLPDCITSLLEQTYKKIEIILVDDGSTDGSEKLCDYYASQDYRIKVIHKINSGLSAARNTGICSSTGDYIMLVDSDDYLTPTACSELVRTITTSRADMVSFAIKETKDSFNLKTSKASGDGKILIFNSIEAGTHYLYGRYFVHSACSRIYKREILEEIPFPYGKLAEDYAVTYKHIKNCNRIAYLDRCLYTYRIRTGSIMNKRSLQLVLDVYNTSIQKRQSDLHLYPAHVKIIESRYCNCLLKTYARVYNETTNKNHNLLSEIDGHIKSLDKKNLFYTTRLMRFLFFFNKKLFCRLMIMLKKNG